MISNKKKKPQGWYCCTHCGETELKEREIHCWVCGIGEMMWAEKLKIVKTDDDK